MSAKSNGLEERKRVRGVVNKSRETWSGREASRVQEGHVYVAGEAIEREL